MKNKHRKRGRNRLKAKRMRWRMAPKSAKESAAAWEDWKMRFMPYDLQGVPVPVINQTKEHYEEKK